MQKVHAAQYRKYMLNKIREYMEITTKVNEMAIIKR